MALKTMDEFYDASDEDDSSADEQFLCSLIVPCTKCRYYSAHDRRKMFGLKHCESKHYYGPLWTKTEVVHGTARMIQLWWKHEIHGS